MKCISANPVTCPTLNKNNRTKNLQALVNTYEDGSSEVACTSKDPDHHDKCSISGEICTLQSEARQEINDLLTMELTAKLAGGSLRSVVDAATKVAIRNALDRTNGRWGKAANLLDIGKGTFIDHMNRLGIKTRK